MRREIRAIALVLAGWLLAIGGSQAVVYFLEHTRHGAFLSSWTLFNLPISFWLTGQFLPLWFIILCVIFNIWMDRHAGRDLDGALRFRVRSGLDEEE
jgi:uncharacterized membrane protein